MDRKEWRQWDCVEIPCTLVSYRLPDDEAVTFHTIRELMKYLRDKAPHKEWKAIKFRSYNNFYHEIKYTWKED